MALHVVMYHYVRDLPRTRFPRIKGMLTDDFRDQVASLSERYEMATLESALAFLRGEHVPQRDLCLLTFDDGLKDHYTDVLPILIEQRIQGLFFVITACLEERRVVPVHKNHFLMAALEFDEYRRAFLARLADQSPSTGLRTSPETRTDVDKAQARRTYRWDTPEVASFKYLLNFQLPVDLRDQVLHALFVTYLGDEASFAGELYLSWDEAREMQSAGMLLGGHSHSHVPLATLSDERQQLDLKTCADLLRDRLNGQALRQGSGQAWWPFSYPYGKADSFNEATVEVLRKLDFICAFATEVGPNGAGQDVFRIRRIDPKDVAA